MAKLPYKWLEIYIIFPAFAVRNTVVLNEL